MITIDPDIRILYEQLGSIRRDLHRIPELAFQEYRTRDTIKHRLEALDLSLYEVARTGIAGFLRGTEGKRTIAFRADIDALPVTEQNDVPYKSEHEGCMHACGHDGHTTILLGLAAYLSANKHQVKDNMLFLFQPAEEGPGGAEVIIHEGVLKKFQVDAIYGLHLTSALEEGKIGVKSGAMMAQNTELDITVKGKSGHGAMPHTGIDSIVIATQFIHACHEILTRRPRPTSPALLSIGKIQGGEARNIIAGEVSMEGIIRTFDEQEYQIVKQAIKDLIRGLEIAHHCSIESEFREMYPPVCNDDTLCAEFLDFFGQNDVEIIEPQMTAEDFAFYQKEIPGLFFFLGSRNEEQGFTAPLHSGNFNFDEKVLVTGVQIFIDVLKGKEALTTDFYYRAD